jgi:hypothetical protein
MTESGPLPGEYGAIDRTGLVGKVWLITFEARRVVDRAAHTIQVARRRSGLAVCMRRSLSEKWG